MEGELDPSDITPLRFNTRQDQIVNTMHDQFYYGPNTHMQSVPYFGDPQQQRQNMFSIDQSIHQIRYDVARAFGSINEIHERLIQDNTDARAFIEEVRNEGHAQIADMQAQILEVTDTCS